MLRGGAMRFAPFPPANFRALTVNGSFFDRMSERRRRKFFMPNQKVLFNDFMPKNTVARERIEPQLFQQPQITPNKRCSKTNRPTPPFKLLPR